MKNIFVYFIGCGNKKFYNDNPTYGHQREYCTNKEYNVFIEKLKHSSDFNF